jgi:hypothetical protein
MNVSRLEKFNWSNSDLWKCSCGFCKTKFSSLFGKGAPASKKKTRGRFFC